MSQNKNVRNSVHKRYNGIELAGLITSINDGRIDVRLIHPLKGEGFICFGSASASAMAGKYVFNEDGSISKEGQKAAIEALVWAYEDALKKKKSAEEIFEIRLRTFDKLNAKDEVLSIEPLEGNNPVAFFRKIEKGVSLPIFGENKELLKDVSVDELMGVPESKKEEDKRETPFFDMMRQNALNDKSKEASPTPELTKMEFIGVG